jgi:peptide/nickel transport system substrate-binding protein
MPRSPSVAPLRRQIRAAVAALLAIVALAACDPAPAQDTTRKARPGGTLYVVLADGLDSLDPQGQYEATAMDVLRLTTRTLTTYKATPGGADEIVPDLATDTGRPSEGNTVWKFTLKPSVKWEGGEPVTCSQVKYGIERSFSPLIDGGVAYPHTYLKDNAKPYQGPYLANDNDGKGLESIICLDERTIEFHLTRPIGDFGYALALSTFAPVIPEKDTKDKYGQRPYSNGPYRIVSRDAKQLVLERNTYWTAANDQVRAANPERVVFTFDPDDNGVITNRLIEDQGTSRNTVLLDSDVKPNFLQQVINDPDLSARAISGPTGAVRYMAINTKMIKDPVCRQALIYAFDRRKWRAVDGGSVTGDYATTMIPPGVAGHKDFDLYQALSNPEGNPDKAAALLQQQAQAGRPCTTSIRVAFPNTSQRRQEIATMVEAYQLAGIEVTPVPLDSSTYYRSGIGDPANTYDMMLAGWIPDWASGSAVLPPNFDGRGIAPIDPATGHGHDNGDFSMLDDPNLNAKMDAAIGETDPARQNQLWGDLDQEVQGMAVAIPIVYEKALRIAGSNVVGGYISPTFGSPDLVSLGLAQP